MKYEIGDAIDISTYITSLTYFNIIRCRITNWLQYESMFSF